LASTEKPEAPVPVIYGKDWDCQRREPMFRNRAAVRVFGAGDLSVMEREQLGAARKTKAGAIPEQVAVTLLGSEMPIAIDDRQPIAIDDRHRRLGRTAGIAADNGRGSRR
jgi:hypothetical protein